MTGGSDRREGRGLAILLECGWYGFGFAVVLALGLVNLYFPFGADQAVFFYGAKEMDQGARLYVEYWDNKQPGLYVFYLVAGRLFGFSEFGVHMLEVIWMMAFAVVLMITLRPYLQAPWLSALAPAATIGVYYATAGEFELTQLEMIVAFPLYVTAWCALRAIALAKAGPAPARMALLFFLGGLFAGLATLFKLLLAPIPVAFWLIASIYLLAGRRIALPGLVACLWIPVAAGVILPLSATVLWFWQAGALQELLWTSFVYPPQALETSPPASRTRLVTATAFFLHNTVPWLLFVAISAVAWLRRRGRGQDGPLIAMMAAWLALACVLFLIQRFSWWEYHMLLLFAPSGILAICGIDRSVGYFGRLVKFDNAQDSGWRSHKLLPTMACAALIALPLTASLTNPFLTKAKPLASAAVRSDGAQGYHWRVSEIYQDLWKGSRFLTMPAARPGPIYVFGSPMVYNFTGRKSAHETAGWSWEVYLPSQTRDVLKTLDEKQVPYILVGIHDLKMLSLRPEVAAYVAEKYRLLKRDDSGAWYERVESSRTP